MKSLVIIWRLSLWLAVLFAVSFIPTAGAAEDARLETRIDALAQPLVNDGKVVGLAIGIIRGGETHVFSGSAAAESGAIAVGDRLVGIEAEGGKFVDFKGKSQRGVLALIRGQRGSTLRLVVEPKEGNGRMIHELVRELIEPVAPALAPNTR